MSKKKIVWIAIAVVVGLGAINSAISDDGTTVATEPTTEPVEATVAPVAPATPNVEPTIPRDEVVNVATEQPTPEATAEPIVLPTQTAAPIPTTPAIDGCTIAADEYIAQVEAGLDLGLKLGLTYMDTYGTYTVLGASIYQTRDDLMGAADSRWSSADTWLIDGTMIYSLSSSAADYSVWPENNTVTINDDSVDALEANCLIPAHRIAAS